MALACEQGSDGEGASPGSLAIYITSITGIARPDDKTGRALAPLLPQISCPFAYPPVIDFFKV